MNVRISNAPLSARERQAQQRFLESLAPADREVVGNALSREQLDGYHVRLPNNPRLQALLDSAHSLRLIARREAHQ
jgi:hypothetical protein